MSDDDWADWLCNHPTPADPVTNLGRRHPMSNANPTIIQRSRSTRRWMLLAALIVLLAVLISWAVTGNPLAVLGDPSGPGGALNLVVS